MTPKIVAIRIESEEEANAIIACCRDKRLGPRARVAVRIVSALLMESGMCMVCECTDEDCSGCVQRTGQPCSWIDAAHTLCSACIPPEPWSRNVGR
jgi:hypothetical protein